MAKKVGYIGLGLMGAPMARNLMKAGYHLVVHNRSRAIVEKLAGEGAIGAYSPKEVARQVDVVFTNLPDSPDVELVALGPDGVIEGAHEGLIFVDNSTIKPETARLIAEELGKAGVRCLDAPVSGGDIGAQAGTLAIMVGGPADVVQEVMPLFKAMGKAIRGGAAQCWTLDNKPQRIFRGERTPGFKAYMQHKDLGIVMDTARAYGASMPLTAVATQLFEAMLHTGMEELDNSAVLGIIELLSDARVGPE
jgi:2-hydroxy-3-oxopropionate reductase